MSVPAYNEQAMIMQILGEVREQYVVGVKVEVIVLDDGSKDDTIELLKPTPASATSVQRAPFMDDR